MPEEIDWSVTTFEGNRRRQLEEFRALSFREKLARIEQAGEVVAYLLARRRGRSLQAAPSASKPPVDREDGRMPGSATDDADG